MRWSAGSRRSAAARFRRAGAIALAAYAWTVAAPVDARADVLPSDARMIAYSYEVTGLDAFPANVFVAWPRSCGSDGAPLGEVDLSLNPQWVPRMHDVDYEVLSAGTKHRLLRYCAHTARVYALPVAAFPRGSRVATRDDGWLGVEAGAPHAHLPALDAIDLAARIPFFAKDARVARSSFEFQAVLLVSASASSLTAVHDVLSIERVAGTDLGVRSKSAVYTYKDGTSETIAYTSGERPKPTRPNALAAPGEPFGGLLGGDGAAGAGETSAATAASGADAAPDGVPRFPVRRDGAARPKWPLVAFAAVLLAGGLWLLRKKKRKGE